MRGKYAVRYFLSPPGQHDDEQRDDERDHRDDDQRRGMTSLHEAPCISPPAQVGDGRQVLDVGVEPGTGAEGVGEDPVERRHQPQAVVEVVLVLAADVDHAVEVVQRRLEVGSGLAGPAAVSSLESWLVATSRLWTASRRASSGAEQHVAVLQQRDQVLVAVGQHPGDLLEVAQQRVELLVAAGDVLRRAGTARAGRPGSSSGVSWSGRRACSSDVGEPPRVDLLGAVWPAR